MSKKVFILVVAESTVIVLLACGLFFVWMHYNKEQSTNIGIHNTKTSENMQLDKPDYKDKLYNAKSSILSVPVEVSKALRKTMKGILIYNCNLEAEKQIDVYSKTNGNVEQIYVEEGDQVTEGNLLVLLDKKEASLSFKEAKVKLDNAKLIFERSQKGFSDKIVSKEEFEEFKLNFQMAQVEYERKILELDYYTVKSPITGIVVGRHIEVGDNVKNDQKIFTLSKFDRMFGKVYVPEKDLNKIRQGQISYISVESIPDIRFEGKVQLINPVIESRTGTVKVTVEIMDEKISLLRPGMFAAVEIIVEKHPDALVIPKKALVMDSIIDEVFVIRYLVKFILPEKVKDQILPDSVARILILSSRSGAQVEDEASMKTLSGKIMEVVEKKIDENKPNSSNETQVTVELTDNVPSLNLEGSIAELNILNDKEEIYLQQHNVRFETEHIAYKKEVELGFSENDEIEVINGLSENDTVIIAGHEDLIQGSRIIVVD